MFISKKDASRITGLNSEELATIAIEKNITRWTDKQATQIRAELEAYQPQLAQSTPEPITNPQPEIPEISDDHIPKWGKFSIFSIAETTKNRSH